MRSVAITGVSGYLGRTLVRLLDEDQSITRIVGIDVVEPGFTARNLEFYSMNIRSPDLVNVVRGCDAIVHLAAVHIDADEIQDVNVGGTRAVTDAAARGGVRKFVFASSHDVYGAHADNDFPLTESSPVRPNHEDAVAVTKAEAETVVRYFQSEHPDVTVTTLRFAFVAGPSIPAGRAARIDAKVRFAIAGYDPPFQAVHEQDAACALQHVLTNDLPGTFNVCADDTVEAPEALLGQRRIEVDLERGRRIAEKTSRLGMSPQAFSLLLYPQVMSGEALKSTGFAPQHSTAVALRQAAEARREWVSIGRFQLRRRSAVVVAGTIGMLAVASALRGRRAKRARG